MLTPPSESLNITDGIVDDLMIELCQILSMLKELFLKASKSDQKILAEQVKIDPDTFRVFYGLSFHLFESKIGLILTYICTCR